MLRTPPPPAVVTTDSLVYSYSNIFVTSPSPDNLHTMFEFVFKGFDALQYQVGRLSVFSRSVGVSPLTF